MMLLLGGLATALLATGCVKTVSGRSTGAVPLVSDSAEGRYERSVDAVYAAAQAVMRQNGVIQNEIILHNDSAGSRAIEGRVNQRRVYIRVEAVDQVVTSVVVQVRTSAGGTDKKLAYELEKQIALRLVK
jgi:hypothetical protein